MPKFCSCLFLVFRLSSISWFSCVLLENDMGGEVILPIELESCCTNTKLRWKMTITRYFSPRANLFSFFFRGLSLSLSPKTEKKKKKLKQGNNLWDLIQHLCGIIYDRTKKRQICLYSFVLVSPMPTKRSISINQWRNHKFTLIGSQTRNFEKLNILSIFINKHIFYTKR